MTKLTRTQWGSESLSELEVDKLNEMLNDCLTRWDIHTPNTKEIEYAAFTIRRCQTPDPIGYHAVKKVSPYTD